MKLALDTSAWSWLRKNEPRVVALLQRASTIFVPANTIGELETAFLRGSRVRENQLALDAFLDEPLVREVQIDRKIARRYGALHAKLRAAGTPIPINDVWIAAAAMEVDARLVTFDSDFQRVPKLSIELLPTPR
ncbi:MAG: type II toxin-antitoxin system VapC family toxin [Archangium sp.]|nr:type II toxin-antitoxin system VapC family toxin [Archangium sp.]